MMETKRYPYVMANLGNLGDAVISGAGMAYYGTWIELNSVGVALWNIHPLFMLFVKMFLVGAVSFLIYRISKGLGDKVRVIHYTWIIATGFFVGVCVSNCLVLLSLG